MKLTRTIAVSLVLSVSLVSVVHAQELRNSSPPAEFPPASFTGKQYVDSRGCIYIRAGIDGNVTWVPRVSRSRKQICGYRPTGVAGTTPATPPEPARAPVIITANPPANTVPQATVTPVIASPKTRRATVRTTSPAQVATANRKARSPRAATTSATRRKPSPGPAPTVFRTVKPAPHATATAAAAPAVVGGRDKTKAANLAPDTRVVPRHVYENRQNTTNVSVPAGYRSVWDDDRLNPRRAERSLRPARVRGAVKVPRGYKQATWAGERLNLRRGARTTQGDARTSQVWTNTIPRQLMVVPTQPRVIVLPRGTTQDPGTVVARVSTRSGPGGGESGGKPLYVRVATYASESDARTVAQSLARTGLPMHLGTVRSSRNRVVLAGPYPSRSEARTALRQLRNAGYAGARLNR